VPGVYKSKKVPMTGMVPRDKRVDIKTPLEASSALTPYSSDSSTVLAATGIAASSTGMPRSRGSDVNDLIMNNTRKGITSNLTTEMTHTRKSEIILKKGRGARNVPITIMARGVVIDPRREIDSFTGDGMVRPVPRSTSPIHEAISPGVIILFRSGLRARSGRRRNTPIVKTIKPKGRLMSVT